MHANLPWQWLSASLAANLLSILAYLYLFPRLAHSLQEGSRYAQQLHRFVRWGQGVSYALGMGFVWEIINEALGIYEYGVVLKLAEAVGTVLVLVIANRRWQLLNTLYPEHEMRRAWGRVAEKNARLRTWDEHTPVARFESKQGRLRHVNPAAERLLGYAQGELDGKLAQVLVHPDELATVLGRIQRRDTSTYETRVVTKSGRVIFVEAHVVYDPVDPGLRLTWLVDVTNYVEGRERMQRQARLHQRAWLVGEQADKIQGLSQQWVADATAPAAAAQ